MLINILRAFPEIFLLLSCGETLVPLVSHHTDFFSKKSFRPFSACRRLLLTPMGSFIWEFTFSNLLQQSFLSEEWQLMSVPLRAEWEERGFPALCHPWGWLPCSLTSPCYCFFVYFWAWKRCEKWREQCFNSGISALAGDPITLHGSAAQFHQHDAQLHTYISQSNFLCFLSCSMSHLHTWSGALLLGSTSWWVY